jgi:hypothetical protein
MLLLAKAFRSSGAALPLSYPGEIGGDKGQSRHSRCQRERNRALNFLTLSFSLAPILDPSINDVRARACVRVTTGNETAVTALAQKDTAPGLSHGLVARP